MARYNPKEIETKWQKTWEDQGIYRASEDPAKPKRYILEYFPYPSGAAMHVGHVRNYTIGDATARFMRMQGYNVLHPMGWDAFGLPAENYAIKTGISPRQAIDQNTARFKQQLMQMGFSYDWSREIDSTDPDYYRWTQWFFLMLYRRGLAYQQESLQWWCPVDKTVLANEQVEAGRCWRCGSEVEKKALKQWFFKITDYADRLLDGLDNLNWSDGIKTMQRNWIGRSKGAEIDFAIDGTKQKLKVFTTRPDTLLGTTFMAVAPEHPIVKKITTESQKAEVQAYIKQAQAKSDIQRQDTDREKTGVFTGAYAINPANDEKIPVWVADYVLYGYGTGAIMAVPGHDERDYEFANKHDLPVKFVVEPTFGASHADEVAKKSAYIVLRNPKTNQVVVLDWGPRQQNYGGKMLIGGTVEDGEEFVEAAKREIEEETGYTEVKFVKETEFFGRGHFYSNTKNQHVRTTGKGLLFDLVSDQQSDGKLDEGERNKFKVTWESIDKVAALLDDGIHRAMFSYLAKSQPYQGEGIMANSGKYDGLSSSEMRDKIVADLAKQSVAKEVINYKMRDWLISRQRYWGAPIPMIHCAKCGTVPVPEDQLPVKLPELKSFEPSGDGRSPLANVKDFVEVKCPECGARAERETDTMDGFACSSWYFLRFADPQNRSAAFDEDKVKLWLPVDDYIGGAEHAVMHLLYARFWTMVMHDEGLIGFDEPFTTLRNQGMILAPDGQKMSKSKGNTIEPDGLIDQGYGADAIRVMELFIGPWNQSANWSVEGMGGAFRFLNRVWTLVQEHLTVEKQADSSQSEELQRATHAVTKKVTEDLRDMSFNTAIAAQMEYVNELYKLKTMMPLGSQEWTKALTVLLQLIAPFAPHIAEELWQQLGHNSSVHTSDWPAWDDDLLVSESFTIVVQVNGKVRANVVVLAGAGEEQVAKTAQADDNVATHLRGKKVKKQIYVPEKLINFVV